jgi:hypothetical protein
MIGFFPISFAGMARAICAAAHKAAGLPIAM